jgi:hypothetical protein
VPEIADKTPEKQPSSAPNLAAGPNSGSPSGVPDLVRSDGAGVPDVATGGENTPVDLGRLAWLATSFACLIAVLVLVLEGYFGYACVTFAVAVSAAINLT